jgi:hypothetical protein
MEFPKMGKAESDLTSWPSGAMLLVEAEILTGENHAEDLRRQKSLLPRSQ